MKGEGGEGESVIRNTDEAIIYTLLLLTYTVWSGMGKVEGEGGEGESVVKKTDQR